MLELFRVGNDIVIWLGGAVAGLAAISAGSRWLANNLDVADQSVIIGDWYGYGYFHSEDGEQFYREEIAISRSWVIPWRLKMVATPCSIGAPQKYRGWVKKIGDKICAFTKEGAQDDICFDIGFLRTSTENLRDKIVGIQLGGSYVSQVHVATGFIWSRERLDVDVIPTSKEPSPKELRDFAGIGSRYFEFKPDSFEFLLRYR